MKFHKNLKNLIIYEKCSGLIVWTIKYIYIYSNVKSKRKVVPVKDMKAYRGSKRIAPLILHIDFR